MVDGRNGSHVNASPDTGAAAADMARAFGIAAFAGDWRKSREHRGLFGRAGAQFAEFNNKRCRGTRSNPWDREYDLVTPLKARIGLDEAGDLFLDTGNAGRESGLQ